MRGRILAWLFCCAMATDAELEAIETAAAETAAAGVTSFSSDNSSATAMDPMKQLDVADRLRNNAVGRRVRTIQTSRIISPGAWE